MQKYTYVPCLSCGRILKGVESHDEELPETLFCAKCRDNDGNVKSFSVVLETVTSDILNDCKCTYKEAQTRAKDRLKRMEYWKKQGKDWNLPNTPE